MPPAIRVQDLGKCYRIEHAEGRAGYRTLRESLAGLATAPIRGLRRAAGGRREEFWALKGVSFDVEPGEVVGIIGRNGAGKSTLLKILSRITRPTTGRAEFRGRIGSLLEVGTGFHPELTGRENVFLNGAILGMSRREVGRKFDEIVDFSGVEAFIDTPVKRYSSGMQVRLAFAVAAHLEPEILIVDEVLAVGDAEFQRKCLGKMQDVGREGRTIFFVSHNLGALQTLCRRGILLKDGRVLEDAEIGEAVGHYLGAIDQAAAQDLSRRTDRSGAGEVRFTGVDVLGGEWGQGASPATGRPARFLFQLSEPRAGLSCVFTLYDQHGHPIAGFDSRRHGPEDERPDGVVSGFVCHFDEMMLVPGRYRLNAALLLGRDLQDHVEGAVTFEVEPGELRGRPVGGSTGFGCVHLPHRWLVPADVVA